MALVLLRRALFLTGMLWIVRGLVGASFIPSPHWMIAARITFYGSVAGALTIFGAWYAFLLYWIVPYCTWHIAAQYTRLICEHSAVENDEEEYAITRTTIPTRLESILVLPRNVGYHLEHHWYPSVPWYRLPALHEALMEREGFREHAVVRRSVLVARRLRQTITPTLCRTAQRRRFSQEEQCLSARPSWVEGCLLANYPVLRPGVSMSLPRLSYDPREGRDAKSSPAIEWISALGCWCAFETDAITAILKSDDFIAADFAEWHRSLGRMGIDCSSVIEILDHVATANEGKRHAEIRKNTARIIAAKGEVGQGGGWQKIERASAYARP